MGADLAGNLAPPGDVDALEADSGHARWRDRLRILEAAMAVVERDGWDALTMQSVAVAAAVTAAGVVRHFPTREHFAVAFYDRLAENLVDRAADLPPGTVASRFATILRWKLDLLEPHRRVLSSIAALAIDPELRAGVLSEGTASVRAKVSGLIDLAVQGATDAPPREEAPQVGRALYAAHLLAIVAWLQTAKTSTFDVAAFAAMGENAMPFLRVAAARLDPTLRQILGSGTIPGPEGRAEAVIRRVLARKRRLPGAEATDEAEMVALHRPRVQEMLDRGGPVELVLPAFPAKAPNSDKVMGALPDMAEWLALRSLSEMLDEIEAICPTGARLVICSDGAVFADVVGVPDADVATYRKGLERMIARIDPARIRFFALEDALSGATPDENRARLLARHGSSVAELQARAAASPSLERMIDGIHRFLFEDELVRVPGISRTQARKQTRDRAKQMVIRSEAWGALVAAVFPLALRLSIHPQPAVSNKLGIHMMDTDDAWLTPWHGAAVLAGDRFQLMRRVDAKNLGAVPAMSDDGLPFMDVRS